MRAVPALLPLLPLLLVLAVATGPRAVLAGGGACPGTGDITTDGAEFRTTAPGAHTYEPMSQCKWTIAPPAKEGECVSLYFSQFDVEPLFDSLTISTADGDELIFDGVREPFWANTTAASVVVRFRSDDFVEYDGVVATVHVLPCRPEVQTDCTLLHDFVGPDVSGAIAFPRHTSCCVAGYEIYEADYLLVPRLEYECVEGAISYVELAGGELHANSTLEGLTHLEEVLLSVSPTATSLPCLPPGLTSLHVELFPSLETIDLAYLGDAFHLLHIAHASLSTLALPPFVTDLELTNAGATVLDLDLGAYEHLTHVSITNDALGKVVWPPNLLALTFRGVEFTNGTVPPLPPSVEELVLEDCDVTTMPQALPPHLTSLTLVASDVAELPPLPASLEVLDVTMSTRLIALPSIGSPCRIVHAAMAHTAIEDVSVLEGCPLTSLDVEHTHVHTLPALTDAMRKLYVSHSKVRRMDAVPEGLSHIGLAGLDELPPATDFSRAREIDVSGVPLNAVNFTLPESAQKVRASGCGLRAIANKEWPPHLRELDLSRNELHTLPSFDHLEEYSLVLNVSHNVLSKLEGLRGVKELDASFNRLTEVGDWFDLGGIMHMDVSHNSLELIKGEVGAVFLNASHNNLEKFSGFSQVHPNGVADLSFNNLLTVDVCQASTMDVSHNKIAHVECDTSWFPHGIVDAQHNALESWDMVLSVVEAGALSILNVAHNNLHGEITFPHAMQSLVELDVSHNARLRGALPDVTTSLPALLTLSVLGTGMHDTAQEACWDDPQTCHFGGGLVLKEMAMTPDRTQECPVLMYAGRPSLLLSVDWRNYTDARMCRCLWGYTGSGGDCRVCPHGAMCEGARMQPVRGHYAHDACQSGADEVEHQVLTCPSTHAEICAPRSDITTFFEPDVYDDTDVPCAPGYEGRMCLSCARGWHSWGALCRECPHPAVLALVVCAFVIIVGIVVYSAYMCKESTTGSLKIMVFLAQMIQLLGSMGSSLDTGLLDAAQSFDSFMLRVPGIECYSPSVDFVTRTWGMMVLPFGLLAFCALVFAVGLWWNATRRTGRTARTWMRTNQRAFLFLLLLLYLPISTAIMSALPCERDACTGGTYFANAPSVRCSTHRARSLRIMAGVAVVWFVAGVPALFAAMAWRVRTASTHADESVNVLDFLTSSFTEHAWWWEAVATARKITIVAIVSFVPSRSIWVALSIVTVLFVSTVGQRAVLPFRERMENTMEYSSLGVSTVCFACSVAFHVPDVFIGPAASIVIAILLYTSFFCVAAVVIAPKRMAKLMHMANVPVHTDSAPLLGGHK